MDYLNKALNSGNVGQLEPITGKGILAASKGFSVATALPDGWHSNTFSLLGDEARNSLARHMNAWERTGQWPTQNSSIHMSSQRKPTGGRRLIGWYRSLFRIWCAIRGHMWKQWEGQHATDTFFGAAKTIVCWM